MITATRIMIRIKILFLALVFHALAFSQKKAAITIDDVPNINLYTQENFRCRLLEKIDSMNLPVTIFINERFIFSTDSIGQNLKLFDNWIKSPNVQLGNHGFSHAMYSAIGIDSFMKEVLNGESITKELAAKQIKAEKYFRFPFNDLGANASQQQQAEEFLKSRGYTIIPFTVHSKDWLFTQLYEYYKSHNMQQDAERTAAAFIQKTLAYFDYIEHITSKKRPVTQIYLMHDNALNADYLDKLIDALKKKGYHFVTLDEALKDPAYAQKNYFRENGGISWVYRWIKDEKKRQALIKQEPDTHETEAELNKVKQLK